MREHLIHLAEGALGGAAGTLFMTKSMQVANRLPEAIQPPPIEGDPGDFMVSQAERVAGAALEPGTHAKAAHALQWAYGVTWPTILAVALPALEIRSVRKAAVAGAALGAGVFALGYLGWLPAAGLTKPIYRHRPGHVANALTSHLLYGVFSALPIFAIDRYLRKRRIV
ncbi:MAG TPA: hypothetical protein VHF22_00030 [Planctomycetota bacterium]|nr:hypothetical protein [Planctomycetota bacterium]